MSILLANLYVLRAAAPHLYEIDHAPPREHVIVPGALVWRGRPSTVLAARLQTAACLLHDGRARRALVSGRAAPEQDEPAVMASYLEELGVDASIIERDDEGPRTFETFASARRRGVTEAVVVTNRFHLSRAVFLARRFGIDAIGVAAVDLGFGRNQHRKWARREVLARARAVWDVTVRGALSDPAAG
jgi:vancomycin permeability regulator SanA